MAARPKRLPKPPRTCWFCGGRPISREHLWAEWMHPYVGGAPGAKPGTVHFSTITHNATGQSARSRGIMHQAGDHRGRRLKVVCIVCNNGWMSELQARAKPVMLPLMLGTPQELTRSEQSVLATWATMFSMVFEAADPDRAATTLEERHTFKLNPAPQPRWKVWAAPYGDIDLPAIHRTVGFTEELQPVLTMPLAPYRFRLSFFAPGKLCFCTLTATPEEYFTFCTSAASPILEWLGFVQLWPSVTDAARISRLQGPLKLGDLQHVRQVVGQFISDQLMQLRPGEPA